jgi:hypothetical protein
MFLVVVSINAQYKYGVYGGMGVSNYVGKDFSSVNDPKIGITFGAFYEREINLTMSFGFELTYEKKGTYYDYFPREATVVSVDSRMDYISLPFLMKAYYGRNANFYIYGGVTGSYMLNHSLSHSATEYGYPISSETFFTYKLNNWDASIIAGFGFNVHEIILDIRYHHGVVNIYEGHNVPSIRNHFLSVALGYSIFKKIDNRCYNNNTGY